jgi:hypothetical protein
MCAQVLLIAGNAKPQNSSRREKHIVMLSFRPGSVAQWSSEQPPDPKTVGSNPTTVFLGVNTLQCS